LCREEKEKKGKKRGRVLDFDIDVNQRGGKGGKKRKGGERGRGGRFQKAA